MILAAGRGERMRPLTDACPKPLLRVGRHSLLERHLLALAAAGFTEVVINLAYRGAQIRAAVGDGGGYGLEVRYSDEGARALETAGGIIKALPLLGAQPFLVVNADIWTDYPFSEAALAVDDLASLVLVDNPPQHAAGDFRLLAGRIDNGASQRLTFAGIGVYHPELFAGLPVGRHALAPLLRAAADGGRVGGTHYHGEWQDIGTPERLRALQERLESD